MTLRSEKRGTGLRGGFAWALSAGMSGLLTLTGCQSGFSKAAGAETNATISGEVSTAAQAVIGANVQLYAAGEAGTGSASQPLLAAPIVSNSKGQFAVAEPINCPSPTSQVYLLAVGGRPASISSGSNPAFSAMTLLGSCENLASGAEVMLNEETTVSAIWSMAQYMRSAIAVGSTADDTAFFEAAADSRLLVDASDGLALPGADATQMAKVNALANLLSTCMNSAGGSAGDGSACGTLFALTTEPGGATPTNTIDAALYIAKNPARKVPALYGLSERGASFHPVLSTVPEDWALPAATTAAVGSVSAEASAKNSLLSVQPAIDAATSTTSPVTLSAAQTMLPGSSAAGLIVLNKATSTDVSVSLKSSNQAYVAIPETITIPSGQTAANFTISAKAAGSATVSASVTGYGSATLQISVSQTGIPATYFGMSVHGTTSTPVSGIQFGTTRSWDANPGVSWADINTSSGVYNFSALDGLLSLNAQRGTDVIYVFGRTPQWASSKKSTAGSYGVGQCAPPTSLADWDNFVRAVGTHAKGKIKYWEFWDEPNNPGTWCGDMPTFVTMAAHASQILKSIDGSNILFSPTLTSTSGPAWLDWYLNSGGGPYADAISFHGYWSTTAEDINVVVGKYRAVMAKYGQGSKALWDTETSWAGDGDLATPSSANQVGFVAKEYLLNWSLGVSRTVWYAYDGGNIWGGLWTSSGGASPAAKAYGETRRWMVGATLTSPCSEDSSGNWTCAFTRPNGYQARAMWNSTRPYGVTLPTQFVEYRDLAGGVHSVVKNSVLLGSQPVLVETSALPN